MVVETSTEVRNNNVGRLLRRLNLLLVAGLYKLHVVRD